jgi:hypothetical protein
MAGHPLKYAALTQRGHGRVLLDGRYHTSLAANTHRLDQLRRSIQSPFNGNRAGGWPLNRVGRDCG